MLALSSQGISCIHTFVADHPWELEGSTGVYHGAIPCVLTKRVIMVARSSNVGAMTIMF